MTVKLTDTQRAGLHAVIGYGMSVDVSYEEFMDAFNKWWMDNITGGKKIISLSTHDGICYYLLLEGETDEMNEELEDLALEHEKYVSLLINDEKPVYEQPDPTDTYNPEQ